MKSPLDKSTIVSIYPKLIVERKVTIEPGIFTIPAGTPEEPAVLTVGPSSWWRDIDVEQPIIEIPVSSVSIAESVVKDYCNGVLGCNMGDSMPGLFFVLGEISPFQIKQQYTKDLKAAITRQNNWFNVLIRLADSLWARSNGNPLAIADEMRLAARMLGKEDKPWLKDFEMIEKVQCPACGSLRNPEFPVCAICKHVDMTNPLAKDMKFAQ